MSSTSHQGSLSRYSHDQWIIETIGKTLPLLLDGNNPRRKRKTAKTSKHRKKTKSSISRPPRREKSSNTLEIRLQGRWASDDEMMRLSTLREMRPERRYILTESFVSCESFASFSSVICVKSISVRCLSLSRLSDVYSMRFRLNLTRTVFLLSLGNACL